MSLTSYLAAPSRDFLLSPLGCGLIIGELVCEVKLFSDKNEKM